MANCHDSNSSLEKKHREIDEMEGVNSLVGGKLGEGGGGGGDGK